MGLIWFYIRKSFTLFRQELLVLPSRVAVLVFVLAMLLIPVFTDDPYLLRILILTSVFAIFAASWDLLSGFTGQVNFGHALFFWRGCVYQWPHKCSLQDTPHPEHSIGGSCRCFDRPDSGDSLFEVARHLSCTDHFVFSDHSDGRCLCHTGCDRRRIRSIRSGPPLQLTDLRLLHHCRFDARIDFYYVEDYRF